MPAEPMAYPGASQRHGDEVARAKMLGPILIVDRTRTTAKKTAPAAFCVFCSGDMHSLAEEPGRELFLLLLRVCTIRRQMYNYNVPGYILSTITLHALRR